MTQSIEPNIPYVRFIHQVASTSFLDQILEEGFTNQLKGEMEDLMSRKVLEARKKLGDDPVLSEQLAIDSTSVEDAIKPDLVIPPEVIDVTKVSATAKKITSVEITTPALKTASTVKEPLKMFGNKKRLTKEELAANRRDAIATKFKTPAELNLFLQGHQVPLIIERDFSHLKSQDYNIITFLFFYSHGATPHEPDLDLIDLVDEIFGDGEAIQALNRQFLNQFISTDNDILSHLKTDPITHKMVASHKESLKVLKDQNSATAESNSYDSLFQFNSTEAIMDGLRTPYFNGIPNDILWLINRHNCMIRFAYLIQTGWIDPTSNWDDYILDLLTKPFIMPPSHTGREALKYFPREESWDKFYRDTYGVEDEPYGELVSSEFGDDTPPPREVLLSPEAQATALVLPKHDLKELAAIEKLKITQVAAFNDGIAYLPKQNTQLSATQANQIIDKLAETIGISHTAATIAVTTLFLKGAASNGTPSSLVVRILWEGKSIEVKKYDLEYSCYAVTGNKYIRRLAETMRDGISHFAEKHQLIGDLGLQINNRYLAASNPGLTRRQLAWCSSFNQSNPYLQCDSELLLVAQELAKDYNFKFKKKAPGAVEKKGPIQPKKKGGKKAANKKPNPKGIAKNNGKTTRSE